MVSPVVEKTLNLIAQQGWRNQGSEFFNVLVEHLATVLDVEYAFVDRVNPDKPEVAETVALYAHGEIVTNISYSLAGTPCENVLGKTLCCYQSEIQQLFPADDLLVEMKAESYVGIPLWDSAGKTIGLIAIMGCKPLTEPEIANTVLQIVAMRAAAELERQRSDAALRESEMRYRQLVEVTNDLVIQIDEKGCYSFINSTAERYLGQNIGDLLGKSAYEFIAPKVGEHTAESFADWLNNEGSSFSYTNKNISPTKEVFWLQWDIVRMTNETDAAIYFNCFAKDVTRLHAAEKAIRDSEKYFRMLFMEFPIAMALINSETGTIVDCNPAMSELSNYERHDLIGKSRQHFHISDDDEAIKKILENQNAINNNDTLNTVLITADGVRKHVEVKAADVELKGTKHLICIFTDITKKLSAENEQRRLQELLNITGEIASIGGCEISLPDQQVTWTKETYRLYEVSDDYQPTMSNISNFYVDESKSKIEVALKEVLQNRQPFEMELQLKTAKGNMRWVHVIGKIRREDDNPDAVIAIIQDITEQKRISAEQEKLQFQLLQSQKVESIGRLAGGVAHDFNNMLGVILGHAELSLMRDMDANVKEDLIAIQKAAERSANLTQQLLAFARKQAIKPQIISLNDSIREILDMLQRLIGESVQLSFEVDKYLWPIMMDPSQIDQILTNLCVNARDAINGNGKVIIKTFNVKLEEMQFSADEEFIPGEYVQLKVCDDGKGIDKKSLENIFEPFYTTKPIGKGTGLGLSTVYGIVKQNKGFINVYSEPGIGTTFNIYLPRHNEEITVSDTTETEESVKKGNEVVLLVEDEVSLLNMTSSMLQQLGYQVIPCISPQEAIQLVREQEENISLLLTDVIMPLINGNQLAQILRTDYPELKVLYMSGYIADVVVQQGEIDEEVQFLEKPFSMHSLGNKLAKLLKN